MWEAIKTPEEMRILASCFQVCPSLLSFGLEGVQSEDLDELGDYDSALALLRKATKGHRFQSFSIGALNPSQLFDALISHSYTSLVDLDIETSYKGDDHLDLSPLTALEDLHLWRSPNEDFLRNGGSLDGDAITLLQHCNAPPSLRQQTVDLNPGAGSDYPSCYGTEVWRYISDSSILAAVPPSSTIVKITGGLFEADEVLNFLLPANRPHALHLLELAVYTTPSSSLTIPALAKRLHALGIHQEISPYEAILTEADWIELEAARTRYCYGGQSLAGAGQVLRWDGGEWEEPSSSDSDEEEGSSVEEG
jgi:hypothetical protein